MTDENPSEDRIAAIQEQVEALEARVEALHRKLKHERQSSAASKWDQYDRPVVESLRTGQDVTREELKARYRSGANAVKSDETLKQRIQDLVDEPEFEVISPGHFRYTGDADE